MSKLVLSRKDGESIVIEGPSVVTIEKIKGTTVRISIEAAPHVNIFRKELNGDQQVSHETTPYEGSNSLSEKGEAPVCGSESCNGVSGGYVSTGNRNDVGVPETPVTAACGTVGDREVLTGG